MQHSVIFDLDGLLIDSETMFQKSRTEAASRLGFNIDEEFYYSHLAGHNLMDSRKILADSLGDGFPFEQFSQLCAETLNRLAKTEGTQVKTGALEILEWLNDMHVQCALATGSKIPHVSRSIEALNFAHFFQEVVTRESVEKGKPNPDLFLKAAERLCVPADCCIILEDSDAGVLAAKSAGMRVIMVPDRNPPNAESEGYAHRIVENLHVAKETLKEMFETSSKEKAMHLR